MGKGLLGSIEELDKIPSLEDVSEVSMADIDEAILDHMESCVESNELECEFYKEADKMSKIEDTVERLVALYKVISEHGICRSTMEAVDPKGELVAKGICCSYEHLSDVPVMDENALVAIEGLGNALDRLLRYGGMKTANLGARIGSAIAGKIPAIKTMADVPAADMQVVKKLKYAKRGGLAGAIIGGAAWGAMLLHISTRLIIYGVSIGKLSHVLISEYRSGKGALEGTKILLQRYSEFDEDRFGREIITSYSKSDFKGAVSAGKIVIGAIESGSILNLIEDTTEAMFKEHLTLSDFTAIADKAAKYLKHISDSSDVKKYIGIGVREGTTAVHKVGRGVEPFASSAEHLGWKASDAHTAVNEAFELAIAGAKAMDKLESVRVSMDKLGMKMRQKALLKINITSEERHALYIGSGVIQSLIHAHRSLLFMCSAANRKVSKSALHLGKAAIRAGKH